MRHRLRIIAILSFLAAFLAGMTLWKGDFDGDSWPDTLRIGTYGFHLFWTGADPPLGDKHPVGPGCEATLRNALAYNDFIGDFLHRDDVEEVRKVRSAALSIVKGAATNRQKVERFLSWLADNWDFTVERSTVNAAELLERRQGMCETCGFLVGALATLGVHAREVTDSRFEIAVEVWLENSWRVAFLFKTPPYIDDRSMLEIAAEHPRDVCIVYYWRDSAGKLFRTKFWYEDRVRRLFLTDKGLHDVPPLSRLRISY